jgi:phosphomannomutase/phosphoglucomutase
MKRTLVTFGLIPFASILGAFVIAVLTTLLVVQSSIKNEYTSISTANYADSYQQQLNIKQDQIISQLNRFAANSRLVEMTSNNDAATKYAEEVALSELIPHAIKVRIFSLAEAELDRSAIPPFSFTSLDLVNLVESGMPVFPEAINANGRWIISVATAIKANDKIVGTLFVYLDSLSISAQIDQNVKGELKLLQKVGTAAAQEVLTLGNGGQSDAVAGTRKLDNPNWTISYKPSVAVTGHSLTGLVTYLIPLVLFLLISAIGIFVAITKIPATLQRDTDIFANQLRDAIAGAYKPFENYQFAGFQSLDSKLASLGSRAKSAPSVKTSKANEPLVSEEDEVVDIAMSDDEMPNETQEVFDMAAFASIFRAYDIRGIIDETLTEEIIIKIGQAIGSEAEAQGEQTLIVGADGRTSSPQVVESLTKGLLASGRDVVSIGSVPTPVLYFATKNSNAESGVMVTGSHNPAEYNGFKIAIAGKTLVESDIAQLYDRIESNNFTTGEGSLTEIDIWDDYMDAILDDVVVAQPLKVVIDCGNGIAGDYAPELLSNLGCEVFPIYCEVDGSFPNHPPDPTVPANLEDLIIAVRSQEADIGIALDGDGDRLVAITSEGDIVWPDKLLMLFAKDVVSRNPGSDVVYDVKCSRHLNSVISGFGGRPIISRSGHSFIKEKMAETDAVLGGELSGHICFGERWFGFDDGIYSAARLIEIVGAQTEGLSELLQEFPDRLSTPEIHIEVDEVSKFEIIEVLSETMDFEDGSITSLDGIRVDFADGWGLIRASNTNPTLTLRFEADDQTALDRIQDMFRDKLQFIREDLSF